MYFWRIYYLFFGATSIWARTRYRYDMYKAERELRPGQFYEDCTYEPMLCFQNIEGGLLGVSLISGKIRGCDLYHCGVLIFDDWKEARAAVERFEELGRDVYAETVERERSSQERVDR